MTKLITEQQYYDFYTDFHVMAAESGMDREADFHDKIDQLLDGYISKQLGTEDWEVESDNPTPQTNVQLVTELMNGSSQGALMQAFVLEAMHNYAKHVKQDIADNPERWANTVAPKEDLLACANLVLAALKKR